MKVIINCCILLLCGLLSRAQTSHLVISQVYTGGGIKNASYSNDFIEIFNPTGKSVNLDGWSVQYTNKWEGEWLITYLKGSIAPGKYYLIQEGSGEDSAGTALPLPDINDTYDLSENGGTIVLSNRNSPFEGQCPSGDNVIDLVGYGETKCSEGTRAGIDLYQSGDITQSSLFRYRSGYIDTDINSNDFYVGLPAPRNSALAPVYRTPVRLFITLIKPVTPAPGENTAIVVEAQDEYKNPAPVLTTTYFTLSAYGSQDQMELGGLTTDSIVAGSSRAVIENLFFNNADEKVYMIVSPISGDRLEKSESNPFSVLPNKNTDWTKKEEFVGIGTLTPTAKLHTKGSVRLEGLTQKLLEEIAQTDKLLLADVNGNLAYAPIGLFPPSSQWLTNPQTDDMYNANGGAVGIGTNTPDPNFQLTVSGNIYSDGLIAIGTDNLTVIGSNTLLAVNGDAIFNRAKVKNYASWPDYVFAPDYKLQPLKELEDFIKVNQHLPGLEPAKEIDKKGIDLGDNQSILLKKIEELTLYVIELNKKVEQLEKDKQELSKKPSR